MLQRGQYPFTKKNKLNIKKLIKITNKWSGLKNLDLAKEVTTKKNYLWQDYKTWKKENGYLKNKKKILHVVAIDYGIKEKYFKIFFRF